MTQFLFVLILFAAAGFSQAPQPKSFVGTISGFRPESLQIEIRPDQGAAAPYEITAETVAQKIAPGARDLKGAAAIKVTDVSVGDRVLVTTAPGTNKLLRIVVMPAQEIAQQNEADRREWEKNGVSGIVSAKSGSRITVKTRNASGEVEVAVTVDEQTAIKRYAPDSVKFTDARAGKVSEVSVGDQLRARGQKSEDGMKLSARDVVFGTFLVKAGSIVSVNPESRQITISELGTKKPLTITITADSQMKQMPSFPGGMPGPGRGGLPGGGPGMTGDPAPGGRGPGGPGGIDINQMLERMPPVTLAGLKPGSSLIVSSTKGASPDRLTAIMVLANADMLIQMASEMSGGGRGGRGDMGPGMGGPGMMGGGGMGGGDLGGLGLSGIIMQ
jgi:hypothetical protein